MAKNISLTIKAAVLLGIIVALPAAIYWLFIQLIVQNDPVTRIPPRACDRVVSGEAFCEERYFDDGLVRLSAFVVPQRLNCCIVERFNLLEGKLNYREMTCSLDEKAKIDCSKYQGKVTRGEGFQFEGLILTIDPKWEESFHD